MFIPSNKILIREQEEPYTITILIKTIYTIIINFYVIIEKKKKGIGEQEKPLTTLLQKSPSIP